MPALGSRLSFPLWPPSMSGRELARDPESVTTTDHREPASRPPAPGFRSLGDTVRNVAREGPHYRFRPTHVIPFQIRNLMLEKPPLPGFPELDDCPRLSELPGRVQPPRDDRKRRAAPSPAPAAPDGRPRGRRQPGSLPLSGLPPQAPRRTGRRPMPRWARSRRGHEYPNASASSSGRSFCRVFSMGSRRAPRRRRRRPGLSRMRSRARPPASHAPSVPFRAGGRRGDSRCV